MKDSIIKRNKIYLISSIIALIVIWQIAAIIVNKEIIIPTPVQTFKVLMEIVSAPQFLTAVAHTLWRVCIAFVMTIVFALGLGLLSSFIPPLYHVLRPLVILFRSVPTMAVILLALIWLRSEKAPILVAFLVTFPILYQNVVSGILDVDQKLIEMAQSFHVSTRDMISGIYLPSIRQYLFAGISTALGLAVKVVIAAEVLSQPRLCVGTEFQIHKIQLNTAGVFAWAFIAVALSGGLDALIRFVFSRFEYGNRGKG